MILSSTVCFTVNVVNNRALIVSDKLPVDPKNFHFGSYWTQPQCCMHWHLSTVERKKSLRNEDIYLVQTSG